MAAKPRNCCHPQRAKARTGSGRGPMSGPLAPSLLTPGAIENVFKKNHCSNELAVTIESSMLVIRPRNGQPTLEWGNIRSKEACVSGSSSARNLTVAGNSTEYPFVATPKCAELLRRRVAIVFWSWAKTCLTELYFLLEL